MECVQIGNRWTWTLLCPLGRVIVYTAETFDCISSAADAAKSYRAAFWAISDQIDYRQAQCI